ncbi:MAG: SDR family oxidoreductase [Deltaproteobacteria bacterium]|nr:SDR family oxidoreductase [Deltaproteobacteria bacterium]
MSSPTSGVLSGRVAVVTGGSRGIGRALAAALRQAGAEVVISGRSQQKLDRTASELDVVPVQADAMSRDEAVKPVAEAIARFGGLDILVNNVGGSAGGNPSLFSSDDDRFEANLTLNLTSAYWSTKAAVASMRSRGHGRIIQIGSGASKHAAASPAYTAAKHGLVGLTKQLAVDLARHQITVNCVCPGWTATDLVSFEQLGAAQGIDAATARKQAEAESAQRRILEPELLGPMVVLLASEAGAPITGQVIGVDGGYRL